MASASITSVDYDEEKQELRVIFANGRTLVHIGVPGAIYRAFVDAGTSSDFYNERIRDAFARL